jgi:hypothetical protein
MRETKTDTEAIVERIHALTMDAGLMPKGWKTQVDEGSPTYGNAWRIAAVCPKTGTHYRHPAQGSESDYLGWSRGEANRTLRLMIQIVAAMGRTKKENRERYGLKASRYGGTYW